MSLFKPLLGNSANLPAKLTAGWAYFCTDTGEFFIDYADKEGSLHRKQINAEEAKRLVGYDISTAITDSSSDNEIPTAKAVHDAVSIHNESIIGLSVDGQVITYIKADGSQHTIVTQDNDTTYSLGTDSVTGLTKLYATTGSAEDGTMTQKAIKTELDKKVGVSVDDTNGMLIFTI